MTIPAVLVGILTGLVSALAAGIAVAYFMERFRLLNGLRSQIAMVREDVELSSDAASSRHTHHEALKAVWMRNLPEIRNSVFLARPYLFSTHERARLDKYWKFLRDLRIEEFQEAGSQRLLFARLFGDENTTTLKQGILRALSHLEDHIK